MKCTGVSDQISGQIKHSIEILYSHAMQLLRRIRCERLCKPKFKSKQNCADPFLPLEPRGHSINHCPIRNGHTRMYHAGITKGRRKLKSKSTNAMKTKSPGRSHRKIAVHSEKRHCDRCDEDIPWRERDNHDDVCPAVQLYCTEGCGILLQRGSNKPLLKTLIIRRYRR